METIAETRAFGGTQGVYRHVSAATGSAMTFAVYVPPHTGSAPLPVLTFLSGLTCTWENCTTKGGIQRAAAEHGVIIVCPDTSPRGLDLPGEDAADDFGTGASFYVDATQPPWSAGYRMYSYIVEDLYSTVLTHFPGDQQRQGLTGHSMGGHGALVCALRNPEQYRSVSAFAPIAAPSQCPWGRKALAGYLGPEPRDWERYDATALVAGSDWRHPILIDQGAADPFLSSQLMPEKFIAAAQAADVPVTYRLQPGYDHSYYFVSSFMPDHLAHHAQALAG